jgi:zinc transport system substrate-binding protein
MRSPTPAPALLFLLLTAAAPGLAAAGRPVVAATVAPLGGLVERLAGAAAEVVVLVPPGFEAESYAPAPRRMVALERAVLAVEVGHPALQLESRFLGPWLERHPHVARVTLAAHFDGRAGVDSGDPHLWTSVRAMRGLAAALARALAAVAPAEAEGIRRRARGLDEEIAALDAGLASRFRSATGRRFLIFHPALGAFAADYGLEQRAIEHDGKEPSPARLATLIEEARGSGARAVLVQRGAPTRAAELLARAIGARTLEIDPMPRDWVAGMRRIGDAVAEALGR